jgi:hypothetical protein
VSQGLGLAPRLRTRLTLPPDRINVPDPGLSEITKPFLATFEYARRMVPTRQFARPIARRARDSVAPLTLGTPHRPVALRRIETVRSGSSPPFAVTRSGLPSPFRSPIATVFALLPVR